MTTAVSDAFVFAWRGLLMVRRVPMLLVFTLVQPVIFVLMFRYVFGGAIRVGGVDYVDFLMPGIFVQTSMFSAMVTAVGVATDIKGGMLERFFSLPIARSAVLVGRSLADLVRDGVVVVMMAAIGFAVGFRIHGGWIDFLLAMLLVLAFGYTFTWVFAAIGVIVRYPEAAQAAAFPVIAPLAFASSAIVPYQSMPGWLQVWTAHQPVSISAEAVRDLVLGQPAASHVLQSLAWMAGILLVFVPLAVWRYRRLF